MDNITEKYIYLTVASDLLSCTFICVPILFPEQEVSTGPVDLPNS